MRCWHGRLGWDSSKIRKLRDPDDPPGKTAALGEVSVVVDVGGVSGAGQGVSTDIIDAAARAYVRALSVAVARSRSGSAVGLPETAAG